MNKGFLIAWLLVFVAWMAGSFVVHGVLLSADYTALQGTLFRTAADSQPYFPLMILAHVVMSGALVWIYRHGRDAGDWLGQGLRFGVAVSLLAIVPTYVIYFVVQPTPLALMIKQCILDTLVTLLLGVLTAWLCRDKARAGVAVAAQQSS